MDETRFEVLVKAIRPGVDPQDIRSGMAALTRSDPAGFDEFITRVSAGERLLVKDGLTGELASRYRAALEEIGLECDQRPMLSLMPKEEGSTDDRYNCPACGSLQPVSGGEYDICGECGVVRQRYEETQAQKLLLEKEHRKFRQGLEWEARQEQERQQQKDRKRQETAIRRMLEKMYGVDALSRLRHNLFSRQGAIAGGILILGIGGVVGAYLLTQHYLQSAEPAAAAVPAQPAVPAGGAAVSAVTPEQMQASLEAAARMTPALAAAGGSGPQPGAPENGADESAASSPAASAPTTPAPEPAVRVIPAIPRPEPSSTATVGQTVGTEPGASQASATQISENAGPQVPDQETDPLDPARSRAALILGAVAVDQAQAGNLDDSREHLLQARQRLEAIADSTLREDTAQGVAYHRARALAELGRRQALAGDIPAAQGSFVSALEVIAGLEPVARQAAAYGFVARSLVAGGDELTGDEYFQQALTTAGQVVRPLERVGALVAVADQARLADRPALAAQAISQAESALESLEQPLERALGLGLLARHRAARLDGAEVQPLFAEAAAAAQGVEDPDSRRQMIAQLFAFQAEALATAVSHRKPGQEEQALRTAAVAWKRAFEVDDPQLRAVALSQVALGFALAGDRERSRQVFEQALVEVPEA